MLRISILLASAITGLSCNTAHADSDKQVLDTIADFADRICGPLSDSGSSTTETVKGNVTVGLNGLAKKLADLGVSGGGEIKSDEYRGVLQGQVAASIADTQRCKLTVAESVAAKLLAASPTPPPSRDPNSLYQNGDPVADAQGAITELAHSRVTFAFVHSSGKGDPKRQFEYQNLELSCPEMPAPAPGSYVAPYSGVIAGMSCTIDGKIGAGGP
jgi:hypothetical protein